MNKHLILLIVLIFNGLGVYAQFCTENLRFTWEGDAVGNKAVWKADDVKNVYPVSGVDVTVSLEDPYGVNTTTSNLSEFGDYSKSNAFYGPGSMMLQITSTASNQPVCMHFEFSSPVIMQDFRVFDIDYIARGRSVSSFQDSVAFRASMNGRNIPLKLDYLSLFPQYVIMGQSARSVYTLNTSGDIQHTDVRGGLKVHSQNTAVNKFTLCYANGSMDDGRSNSHAVKLVGFDFCKVGFGNIGGTIRAEGSNLPLAGGQVQLFDTLGQPVLDEEGQIITALTGVDGAYLFENIPLGHYLIVQTKNPTGYHSVTDIDGVNDDRIKVVIHVLNPNAMGNDFFKGLGPLPVEFGGMSASWYHEKEVLLNWFTYTEINNAYFTVLYSPDGKKFEKVGIINGNGTSAVKSHYRFFHAPMKGKIHYYKIIQVDADGRTADLGVTALRETSQQLTLQVIPNPVSDYIQIAGYSDDINTRYQIIDVSGKVLINEKWTGSSISVTELAQGLYYVRFLVEGKQYQLPFMKQ